ncbi:hypothetical protein M422DRAFT_140041, partial [Sphaerobolus stellatus SS14]
KKKRGGAPKAKGAVRAKSGCYTCRIRRKKCDERPDADGNCQTCVRLRLECLGFGAKRPDWMRENNSVQELREKIKQFLASQGMIKGHSGGGVRPAAEREPTVLPLSTDSSLQHGQNPPPMPPNGDPNQMRGPRMPPLRETLDPTMVHFLPSGHPFPGPPGQGVQYILSMPGSASSRPPPNLAGHPPLGPSAPPLQPHSSFGASYNINDDYFNEQQVAEEKPQGSHRETAPAASTPSIRTPTTEVLGYVSHYMTHVLKIQYLMADATIERFIFQFAQTSPVARSAMCLLSAVHQQRMRQMGQSTTDVDNAELDRLLRRTKYL